MEMKGKVAVVTGGGQAIGRATALLFAREGASVVVADINPDTAEQVANEIRSKGGEAKAVKTDVAISSEVNNLVQATLDAFGKIDILVNNAGITKVTFAEDLSEAEWEHTLAVNLKGPFLCSQGFGRHMIRQKGGKIVNVGSVSGHFANPGQAAYCASKAGLLLLTKVLAIEWAKYNINVNAVSPGMTKTPILEEHIKASPTFLQDRLQRIPTGRANNPEDLANAIFFLSSSKAGNITGQEIIVDGGVCALHPTASLR